MAKQTINIGASPNDGTGTPLRTAFDYCNLNFTELYTATGPSGNNIVVPGSATITGDLTVDTSTLKVVAASDVVGINTASPLTGNDAGLTIGAIGTVKALNIGLQNTFARLREKDAIDAFAITTNITGSNNQDDATKSSWKVRFGFGNGNDNFLIGRSNVGSTTFQDIYSVSATSAVWSDGAGGTRMTLNATGLGVGTSPTVKIDALAAVVGNTNALTIGNNEYGGATYLSSNSVSLSFNRGHSFKTGAIVSSNITNGNLSEGYIKFQTSTSNVLTDRMLIDNAGNVGIGVTPSAWGSGISGLQVGSWASLSSANAYGVGIGFNNYYNGTNHIYSFNNGASKLELGSGLFKFFTAPSGTAGNAITFTQAMTLDASGNLSVGATSVLNGVRIFAERSGGSVAGFNRTTSDGTNVLFYREGLIVGDVSVTTTGTTFNSTSDYRLKESVQPMSGGLARVSALKPSIYKWKSNGSNGEGFLAHELAEVVPAAVTGEKDAVNEDGSIKAQSIDMSRIVPILVAAIQELTARVQTLEAK